MKYIRWFLYVIADFVFTILCYFTNPIVVLFADERGRLPKIFKLWQTYDNTLDVGWMVTEGIVPKIFRYNYNSHYYYVYEDKSKYPCEPGKVFIVNPLIAKAWEEKTLRLKSSQSLRSRESPGRLRRSYRGQRITKMISRQLLHWQRATISNPILLFLSLRF